MVAAWRAGYRGGLPGSSGLVGDWAIALALGVLFRWSWPLPYGGKGHKPGSHGLLGAQHTHRYTEWRSYSDGKLIANELYEHRNDNAETINMAAQPNALLVSELQAQLIPRSQL